MTRRAPSTRRRPREVVPLRRVVIANRGEIAVRIVRACRDLGLESVVLYSEADRASLAVTMADRALCIGPAPAAASYLRVDAILAAALAVGADAVHPGYGFLAENARFAAACAAEGLRFVGPPPAAIEALGDKLAARRLAASIGVPIVPGSPSGVSVEDARRTAERLGYPVMVKAAAGGGGRGMRLARDGSELEAFVASAAEEARSAFGDGSLYLEKYLPNARHVEVQVVADSQHSTIHLGERDCTIQRRYQKLVEEAPSPAVTPVMRAAMTSAAVRLAQEVAYEGVGTVEFLLDQDSGKHYFIEMNTRLQVEHPVTEAITGLDLVALQLRLASGEPLPLAQVDIELRGHAIEFRLNAEDPAAGFLPQAGELTAWSVPLGPGTRVDTHCYPGYRIPPYYDSLLAKLIVAGATREEALARSRRALRELLVEGVPTTKPFHQWLLGCEDFVTGRTSTGWVERAWPGRTA